MDLITRYLGKETRAVVGLMSGTSADGVDIALAQISGSGDEVSAQLSAFAVAPYQKSVRRAVLALFEPDAPVIDVCRMNFALGRVFAEAVLQFLRDRQMPASALDLIASHGQTICHLPPHTGESVPGARPMRPSPVAPGPGEAAGFPSTALRASGDPALQGSTLQIGEPAVIAEMTGVTVVADFRPRDLAAGGQGAPLVPYADYALFRHAEKTRAVQNIGGIANVTVLPAGAGLEAVIAFDTGPGNMIIDALVSAFSEGAMAYDKDGSLSALGQVDEALLRWLMSHDFIGRPPPKSTGREEFGSALVGELLARAEQTGVSGEDLLTTATAFTAESIAAAYREFVLPRHAIDEVILGGGGSYNLTLRRMLQQRLPGVAIFLHEDFGLHGDAKEALAFAILGNETMLGRPANLPQVTGARHPVVLGKIVPAG